jgi:hypothetical protein
MGFSPGTSIRIARGRGHERLREQITAGTVVAEGDRCHEKILRQVDKPHADHAAALAQKDERGQKLGTPVSPGRSIPKSRTPARVVTIQNRFPQVVRGNRKRKASVIGGKLKPCVGEARAAFLALPVPEK